jgi:hypothetical protein
MNKVLKRSMFSMPKHEHKSTGIASGLEYRPGYRVGGRVGFDAGGPVPHPHPHVEEMKNPNPNVGMGSNIDTQATMDLSKKQYEDLYGGIPSIDYNKYATDYSKYATDYSKYEPSRLGAVGQAAGMTISEPIPEGQSQWAKFFGNLSQTTGAYKERRNELDMLAEADAKKMEMMTDQEANQYKMKTEEAIRNSDIAEADKVADLYTTNVDVKLAERGLRIEEMKALGQDDSLLNQQMKLVEDIVSSGASYQAATKEAQAERMRFSKADELANNIYLKAMTELGEQWMEDAYTGGDYIMTANDLTEKRNHIVNNMNSLYPGFTWELIVPELAMEEKIDVDALQDEVSSLSIYNPELSELEQNTLKQALIDGDQSVILYNDLMAAKKEGKTTFSGNGQTAPIEDLLDQVIPLLQERYKITLGK